MKRLAIRRIRTRKPDIKTIRRKLKKFMLCSKSNERELARLWLDKKLPNEPVLFNEGIRKREELKQFFEKSFKDNGKEELRIVREYRSRYAIMIASKIITGICSALMIPLVIMDIAYGIHISTFIVGIFGAYSYYTSRDYRKQLNNPDVKKIKKEIEKNIEEMVNKYEYSF